MVVSLLWKEKVVHSALVLSVFVFSFLSANSQSTPSVTFTYNSVSLKELIENLARVSGRHIIYSSDKIDLTTKLSLAVRSKTVEEVLLLLEERTNLSLTMLDHHIVIKQSKLKRNVAAVDRTFVPMQPTVAKSTQANNHTLDNESTARAFSGNTSLLRETLLTKNLKTIQKLSEKTILISLPGRYIPKINADNKGWFISAGTLINDHSAGFELRAGLPRLFAVFSPAWHKNSLFDAGYGLGTWFPLSSKFSVNTIYTYSKIVRKETYPIDADSPMLGPIEYQATTNQHRLKLRLQYALYKNVRLELGPTFNQSNTRYILQESFTPSTTVGLSFNSRVGSPGIGPGISPGVVTTFTQINQTSPQAQSTSKFWLGWEASISCRVNFSYQK